MSSLPLYGYRGGERNKGQGHKRNGAVYVGRAWDRMTWGVKSHGEKGAGRSQQGGEQGPDMKTNLTHLPRIPALSATINTFTLFVLISREMSPLMSSIGRKRQIKECAFPIEPLIQMNQLLLSIYIKENER